MQRSHSDSQPKQSHNPQKIHHEPQAHDTTQQRRTLLISFIIISGFMFVEALGGWLTHSLALLSDAGHMLSDAVALGATLLAFKIGEKEANKQKSFGYKRFEILVAGANGTTLIIISVMIVIEAIGRFNSPPDIATKGMLIIATIGMLVNILVAWLLHRSITEHDHSHSHTSKNLNMHSAFLHVLSDLLGSIGAIIAALAMMWFEWWWADPVASILIALLILVSGYRVVKASVHILMEGTPKDVSLDKIVEIIMAHDAVNAVHDLHVWSITSGLHALSCHVVVNDDMRVSEASESIYVLGQRLQNLGISHATFQIEGEEYAHCSQDNSACKIFSRNQKPA